MLGRLLLSIMSASIFLLAACGASTGPTSNRLAPKTPSPTVIVDPETLRPTDLTIRTDLHTHNSLDWDEYRNISFWEVWARQEDGSGWTDWQRLDITAVSNYAHIFVTPGTTYEYRVRAISRRNEPMGIWAYAQHTVPTPTPSP